MAETPLRTAMTWILAGIWCALMAFAAVSLLHPAWLDVWSRPGKATEVGGYRSVGDQYMRVGNYPEALQWYGRAFRVDSTDVTTRVNMAIALGKLGRYPEGFRLLESVLRQKTADRGTVLYNLAELQTQAGDRRRALESYRNALQAGAAPELVHGRLGDLQAASGDLEEARTDYREALRCREDPVLPYRRMLEAAREQVQGDSAQLRAIDAALAREITEADLVRYDMEFVRGQIARDPDRARLMGRLAQVEAQLGDANAARQHLRDALTLLPPNPEARAFGALLEKLDRQPTPPGASGSRATAR